MIEAHSNLKYHVEMLLNTLNKMKFPNQGDTRNYLDIDEGEHKLITKLLQCQLDILNQKIN